MSQNLYPKSPILIVEDDEDYVDTIDFTLRSNEINNVESCMDGREVEYLLKKKEYSIILLDLGLGHMRGEELLPKIREEYPYIDVIVVTAADDVQTSVECMKNGAFDYIVKPFDNCRLITTINHALKLKKEREQKELLKKVVLSPKVANPIDFEDIITENSEIIGIFKYIEAIANSTEPVLITGETGSGKGLVAHAIHKASKRKAKGFITVNVGGLDDQLFSDTLFGHIRGAFTGAIKDRKGRIEVAQSGTLFLDEIGELSQQSQVKLLDLIQDKKYSQLGSDIIKKTDARIIVATNQNLQNKIKSGEFRIDLYYRLKCHHIHIPPLRERKKDIPHLIMYFIGKKIPDVEYQKYDLLKDQLIHLFSNYNFPGNIRELESMVYDAISRYKENIFSMETFKAIIANDKDTKNSMEQYSDPSNLEDMKINRDASANDIEEFYKNAYKEIKRNFENKRRVLIEEALRQTNYNKKAAANLLGISRNGLSDIIKKNGIKSEIKRD